MAEMPIDVSTEELLRRMRSGLPSSGHGYDPAEEEANRRAAEELARKILAAKRAKEEQARQQLLPGYAGPKPVAPSPPPTSADVPPGLLEGFGFPSSSPGSPPATPVVPSQNRQPVQNWERFKSLMSQGFQRLQEEAGKVAEAGGEVVGRAIPGSPFEPGAQAITEKTKEGMETGVRGELAAKEQLMEGEQKYSRENRLRRLRALRDISEGLGSIEAFTPGEILHKTGEKEPYVAESLRQQELELQDQLTPAEHDWMKSQGITVPKGTRWSKIREIIPMMAQAAKAQAQQSQMEWQREKDIFDMWYKQASLTENMALRKAQMETLDAYRQHTKQMSEQLFQFKVETEKREEERRKREFETLKPSEVKVIVAHDTLIAMALEIKKMKQQFNTGPIVERLSKIVEFAGFNQSRIPFRQAVMDQLISYVNSKSGAQFSWKEAQMYKEIMPGLTDNDAGFENGINRLIEQATKNRDNALRVYGLTGRDVEAFKMNQEIPSRYNSMKVIYPDGTEKTLPRTSENVRMAREKQLRIEDA